MVLTKKKALLVGIQYEDDADGDEESANALRGPHTDVEEMRKLLIGVFAGRCIFLVWSTLTSSFTIDCYGYAPGDIVVLIDRDEPGQVMPTRVNMVCVPSRVGSLHADTSLVL